MPIPFSLITASVLSMTLRSPVADFPDMSEVISDNRARANSLFQAAWAGLGEVQQRHTPEISEESLAAQMGKWGQSPRYSEEAYIGEDGFASNVPRSLLGTESGGNWEARNSEAAAGGQGHFGILQFSPARLQEAINSGSIPQMTPEQFLKDKNAQKAAANWHFSDIDRRITANGLDRYLNQTVGGVPMTMHGMRAVAHLGGFGGLSRFLKTNGQYNPADAYGTSLSSYAYRHQGG